MGRPPAHATGDLIDAAVRLCADGGARAVTMAAVARQAGAPSGSVYHRFPDRPALLAALWLRTVRRFQQSYFDVLSQDSPIEAAVTASAHAVRWCRANPEQALVLYGGKRALGHDEWSEDNRAAAKQTDHDLETAWRAFFRRLQPVTGLDTDELTLILVDLPFAALRRYLQRGEIPPPHTVDLVAHAARTLLTGGPHA